EVTDDWNLTLEWRDRVLNSPTGRRVVANALAAYSVFQAWGNNPKVFSEAFFAPVTAFFANGGGDASNYEAQMLRPPDAQAWSYVAPTTQPVVVLDTRTRRGPSAADEKEKKIPAELMDDKAVQEIPQLIASKNLDVEGKILTIVSPAVVFGVPLIEPQIEG